MKAVLVLAWAKPVFSGLLVAVVLTSVQAACAEQAIYQQSHAFDIPSKSADESLIDFAKQAGLTIIFPFEKVKQRQANALTGHYSTREGINILLKDTGLVADLSRPGTLTIKLEKTELQDQSLLTRLINLLSAEEEKLVTYPSQDEAEYERITITGIRASTQRSMHIKHTAFDIMDVIQAEEIGKFPDSNLAESLQRITGVSIDRSGGEGQFVTVRGFGPEFNTVLVNERRLATDNLGREFSFDMLASELINGVAVHKTYSASQQAGGVGSTINIDTARPLTTQGFKAAASLKAVYDSNSNKYGPQGSLLFSHSDDKFGWLLSLSHQQRQARTDEAQIDGWLLNTNIPDSQLNTSAENIFVPRNYDQRVRFDQRTRTGGTLVLQYKPSDDTAVSFDYLRSDFAVKTNSTSIGHWFTSSNLENVLTDQNGTVIQFEQNVGHATDFHARTFDRPAKIDAIGINANWRATNSLKLIFDLSSSNASIKDTRGSANALSLIGYLNRARFDHAQGNLLPGISGFADASAKVRNAEGVQAGVSHYLDPANGRAHVMLRRGWNIQDDFDQLSVDGKWDIDGDWMSELSFGLMLSRQRKQNQRWDNEANAVHCSFCGYFSQPDIPDHFQHIFDAGGDFLRSLSGHQSIPKVWLRHDGEQLFDYLESVSNVSFDAVQRSNSFSIQEKITGAYGEMHLERDLVGMPLAIRAGLRFEQTDTQVSGLEADLQALTILDQTELGQITSTPRPLQQDVSYHNWLPSLIANLEIKQNLMLRAAYSHSLTRPTMTQMSPSLVLNTTRQGGDLRASSGNPELKPFQSNNLDLSLEWYYSPSSYLSGSYFRKKVENFIVSNVSTLSIGEVTDPSTGLDPNGPDPQDSIAQFDLTQPVNGQTAIVSGWELAIQHNFASGFGLIANMTLVDSNAQLDRDDVSQKFALTGLSDSQNLILYYEKGPVQIRFAWNRRDGFLQSLVQTQGEEPTFVKAYQQLDMSASYALNQRFSVFVEGINLSDEPVIKHGRYANQLLLAQSPGARYTLGIRGSF